MRSMLHWTVETKDDGELIVTFEGEITGHAEFSALAIGGRRVVLDLAGVRRMNSQGVHGFLDFLGEVGESGSLVVERCSPAIVLQLNLLPTMADLVTVRSLYLPLECPRCFWEGDHLLELTRPGRRPPLPTVRCPRCGHTTEPAEPPDRYLAFLQEDA